MRGCLLEYGQYERCGGGSDVQRYHGGAAASVALVKRDQFLQRHHEKAAGSRTVDGQLLDHEYHQCASGGRRRSGG